VGLRVTRPFATTAALACVFCAIPLGSAAQQRKPRVVSPLTIATESVPKAYPRQDYRFALQATGGVVPYRWSIFAGALPDGMTLDESGVLSGAPTKAGEFHFTAEVRDSAVPAEHRAHEYTLKVVAPLVLEWGNYPVVNADSIAGSVKIQNGTEDDFDQTVIVLAVNEYGKAFTLGYQHFILQPSDEKTEIPFGMQGMPRGTYTVHVDAVGEVPEKYRIYRNRLQTPLPLKLTFP
jgi:Putative Ig domain